MAIQIREQPLPLMATSPPIDSRHNPNLRIMPSVQNSFLSSTKIGKITISK